VAATGHLVRRLFKALGGPIEAEAGNVLPNPVTRPGIVQARDSPAECRGESGHVAAAENLADAGGEIRSAPDLVRDHRKHSARHRLVDHQAPGLCVAREHQNVRGMIIGREIRLVDEAGNGPCSGNQRGPHVVGQGPVTDKENAHLERQELDCGNQIERTLPGDQLAAEQNYRPVGRHVPLSQQIRSADSGGSGESFIVHRIWGKGNRSGVVLAVELPVQLPHDKPVGRAGNHYTRANASHVPADSGGFAVRV
jgi:hypothetical protein